MLGLKSDERVSFEDSLDFSFVLDASTTTAASSSAAAGKSPEIGKVTGASAEATEAASSSSAAGRSPETGYAAAASANVTKAAAAETAFEVAAAAAVPATAAKAAAPAAAIDAEVVGTLKAEMTLKKKNFVVSENDDWIGFRVGMRKRQQPLFDEDDDEDGLRHQEVGEVKFSEIIAVDAATVRACGKARLLGKS